MQMGLIGLGKMGGNMRERLRRAGHTIIGFDTNPEISDATSQQDMIAQLTDSPRVVWVMVPDQVTDGGVIDELAEHLSAGGDIVIDGGNSKWTHDARHAEALGGARGIRFLDCGVSGGVWGLENGYALMCGGPEDAVQAVMPIFDALKPAGDSASCTPATTGRGTSPRWCTTASSTA